MKRLLALALIFFLPLTAFASMQVILNQTGGALSTGQHFTPIGSSANLAASQHVITSTFPVSGTVSNLQVTLVTAPGAAVGYNFGFFYQTATSSLVCSIIGASATTCSDFTDTVSVVAGQDAQIVDSPVGSPTGSIASYSFDFTPANSGDTIVVSAGSIPTTAAGYWYFPAGGSARSSASSTEAISYLIPFAEGGTLDQFYFEQQQNNPTGGATTTLRVNSATTTVTLSLTGTTKSGNDTTHSAAISTGQTADLVQVITNAYGSSDIFGFGLRFTATNPGDFPLSYSSDGQQDSTNATRFIQTQGGTAPTATESSAQEVTDAMNITALTVNLYTTPLTSKTFTLRDNGANTSLGCTVTNPATTCSATGFVHVNRGDLLDTADVPSGTAGASYLSISYIANTNPTAATQRNTLLGWIKLFLSSI